MISHIVLTSSPICATSLDSSSVIDLSSYTEVYLDSPPYEHLEQVLYKQFIPLKELRGKHSGQVVSTDRYWIKINDVDEWRGKVNHLSFGNFNRNLLYISVGDSTKFLGHLGAFYKRKSKRISSHYLLLPTSSLGDNTEVIYSYASSNEIKNEPISAIEVKGYAQGAEMEFIKKSSFTSLRINLNIGVLMLLSTLALLSIIYIIVVQEYKFLSFVAVCIFLSLYYIRNIEGFTNYYILWSYIDEGIIRYESLIRYMIAVSFTFFTLLHFEVDHKKRIYQYTFIAFSFGLFASIWRIFTVGPFQDHNSLNQIIYLLDIIIIASNSAYILYRAWLKNDKYVKHYITFLFIFIITSYSALFLNDTWLGKLDNWFSAELYSSYSLILFILVSAYCVFKKNEIRKLHLSAENEHAKSRIQLGELKMESITNIVHEIKTPLSILHNLGEESLISSDQKKLLNKSKEDLLELVEDAVSISSSDTYVNQLQLRNVDIVNLLKVTTESFHSLANQKGIQINFTSDTPSFYLEIDEKKVQHIQTNLLTNALEHVPVNGQVEISIIKRNKEVEWKVHNTGSHIAKHIQLRIFDRHYTHHENYNPRNKNTGIGLSYVKELIALMNGRISISSSSSDGTTFAVSIPINKNSQLHEASSEANYSHPNYVDKYQSDNPTEDEIIILIVEDNKTLSDYIVTALNSQFRCITASNGLMGLEVTRKHLPDLIIADVMMPILNGYQMTRIIKSDDQLNHIPVILLTAKSSPKEKEQGLSEGADAYLIKPFDKSELRLRVQNIINTQRQLHKRYQQGYNNSRSSSPKWLDKLESYVITHLNSELNSENLCKEVLMSRTQLHRKLKSSTGMSASEFVKYHRLTKALHLLRTTEYQITRIADHVGYKSLAHFSSDFSRRFGKPPSKMRE